MALTDEELEKVSAAEDAEDEDTEDEAEEEHGVIAAVKKAFSVFTTLLLVGLLALLVYVTVSAARGKAVQVFGRSVLTVVTGSMEPTLHVGDYIFIEKTDPAKLKEGDIISFYSEQSDIFGMLVTHRIAAVNDDGTFITRGDANPVDDSVHVRPERIVGKYTRKAQLFRWASSFGDFRKLLLLAVMIMTSAAAIYEVITIGRLKHTLDEEKRSQELEREQKIREAIEKEKERLAAEGFGLEKREEEPAQSEENAAVQENDTPQSEESTAVQDNDTPQSEEASPQEEKASVRGRIKKRPPRSLRIEQAKSLKTPVTERKARTKHKKIT